MSWTCSKCTFKNPGSQKLRCQICLSPIPQSLLSSLAISCPAKPKWSCAGCTFLNPYGCTTCEICGSRASASMLSTLEVDDDDLDQGPSIGSVFLPLKSCNRVNKEKNGNSSFVSNYTDCSGHFKHDVSSSSCSDVGGLGSRESPFVDNGVHWGGDSGEKKGFLPVVRHCSKKRKDREGSGADGGGGYTGGASGFRSVKDSDVALDVESSEVQVTGGTHLASKSRTWKILSYNIWFREDLEMHGRMKALGELVELHSPDVICFQEVTPSFYEIFEQSSWWKEYRCSISNDMEFPGPYFCMQLCKLTVKSYSCKPFHNSIMGRVLCLAEVEVLPDVALVVATSHLESPCPSPPKWDQMFSKERVDQAKEAVKFLDENLNVIFCGDMNWDDKLDGGFPLADEWIDAWTELRPGEIGWTYDTKSNKMLSGNRTLQKRLDRFVCKLKDFKVKEIEMIGMDAIEGLSYIKEKRVKGQVTKSVLPVLPSDHYGLLLTISRSTSQ
ncbi:tyrosyl-DNA phosphodiesterase 2-like [Dorcoceras hygrometricum]|uniref:Tyrosyl-DNA phosphodiesterase 2-like n=1 Tax=Dorcoceras hygrometricum TaxID=472368 RepID=A0A2Z7A3U1_9LAMI|nr:tyrosyl-DNA phosphodiesterase 2-like [Dorcoceras hygrometricum]